MNPSTKLVSELSCVRRLDRRPMLEISMHWPSQILHFTTCLPLLLVCKLRLQEKGSMFGLKIAEERKEKRSGERD